MKTQRALGDTSMDRADLVSHSSPDHSLALLGFGGLFLSTHTCAVNSVQPRPCVHEGGCSSHEVTLLKPRGNPWILVCREFPYKQL